jgi:hypothetical protein
VPGAAPSLTESPSANDFDSNRVYLRRAIYWTKMRGHHFRNVEVVLLQEFLLQEFLAPQVDARIGVAAIEDAQGA